MHVVYIHQHFSTKTGATGTRSYEMSQRLLRAGHSVTMLCGLYEDARNSSEANGQAVVQRDIDGIHVYCLREPYSNKMSFARRLVAFGRFARGAASIASRLDADLIFATSTPLTVGIPGMKAAARLRIPFVFEVRDLWPELPISLGVLKNPLLKWYARRMEHRIYHAAAGIIALAPGIKQGICQTGISENRVCVIPNGCDLDLFQPTAEKLTDPNFGPRERFKAVFTGAHGLANGLDCLIDVARVLRQRGETGIQLLCIGEGGQKERLIAQTREEGLNDLIKWLPSIPKYELARVLPQMDLGMMILKNIPAFYFGTSPNKFFDYIASGLPVLNNYPGWLADMIGAHQCGRVVPPDDPVAFADALIWLRDHRAERAAMGRNARALAESSFSRDMLGTQFVQFLESYSPVQNRRTDALARVH